LNTLQGAQPQQQQFEQTGWERGPEGGASQQNPWGQPISPPPGPFSPLSQQNQGSLPANNIQGLGGGLQQTPFQPRRPSYRTAPQQSKVNPRLLLIIASLFVVLAAVLLIVVFALASASGGSPSSTASSNTNPNSGSRPTATVQSTPTASASTPAASTTPTDTSAYPGQQYIDGAQMAAGVDKKTLQAVNPTTTFKAGTPMYVVFALHPPGTGGAVCSYWYLGATQVTSYPFAVRATSKASYTYATYASAGSGYVELYWASSKSCSDKMLAQKVEFTVTA
jgi:hypothetical protein